MEAKVNFESLLGRFVVLPFRKSLVSFSRTGSIILGGDDFPDHGNY